MDALKTRAKELLASKQVAVVIGYGQGTNDRVRAIFVRNPADADKLIFDERCLQNLTTYLPKHEVKRIGKPAIVVSLPGLRTILQLASEEQITENDVVVLGISEQGQLLEFPNFKAIETYVASCNLGYSDAEKQRLEEIQALPLEERYQFWNDEFSKCFKCYACRQACPLCYCSRCTVECNQPQWIAVPSHDLGNLEWHVMRAMHLAGRCINCGDCARACPMDIPLNLLNQQIAETIFQDFGTRTGVSAKQDHAMSTFRPDDKEDFIR
jgi:ferredoxin